MGISAATRTEKAKIAAQGEVAKSETDLTVILPTRNESGNIDLLLKRIKPAIRAVSSQVIFVDDSTDDTPQVISRSLARSGIEGLIIARPPELRTGGLSGAVVEGMKRARGAWICVMDADLQHPPEVIPTLMSRAEETSADIVVASRFAAGSRPEGLSATRFLFSRLLTACIRALFPRRLAKVSDPLTGLFLVRRRALDLHSLRPEGFKILLEILVRCPELRVAEIPFEFGRRHSGDSKATLTEGIRFVRQAATLRLGAEPTFVRFLLVGASGLVVNTLALSLLTELVGLHYLASAIIATQFSTLWNFAWTETWVFAERTRSTSVARRFVSYWVVNNLSLLLRGPLLSVLVSVLGLHYVLGNLISIFVMTLVRYVLADRWIWRPARQAFEDREFTHSYDIHGVVRVQSMFPLPELEYFETSILDSTPDIRVRIERRRESRPSSKTAHYVEWPGRYGFEVSIAYRPTIEIAVSPILMRSPHVLYTNVVEPILRWTFVRKGYALAHAACISFDGRATLVTAATDTGKTTTILKMLAKSSCGFLSDDMTILAKDGQVLSYPKPLTISLHTLHAVDTANLTRRERMGLQIQSRLHSRQGRLIGLLLGKSVLPAATLNALVQLLIPPPKYGVQRLVPHASIDNSALLTSTVLIERGPQLQEDMDHASAVDVLIRNAEDAYGFPPYPKLAGFLSTWKGKDLHKAEREIIEQALNGRSATRLRDPMYKWWSRVPGLVMEPQ